MLHKNVNSVETRACFLPRSWLLVLVASAPCAIESTSSRALSVPKSRTRVCCQLFRESGPTSARCKVHGDETTGTEETKNRSWPEIGESEFVDAYAIAEKVYANCTLDSEGTLLGYTTHFVRSIYEFVAYNRRSDGAGACRSTRGAMTSDLIKLEIKRGKWKNRTRSMCTN